MTYHRVCNYSNTMGAISEMGIACHFCASEVTLGFSWVRVTQSLVFCVVFCT
jgi:hypothetical protein